MRGIKRRAALAAALFCAWTAGAQAQAPDKPIKLIVPLPAGGPVDAVAREMASLVNKAGKQAIYVENIAGAYGAIGLNKLSKSPPDGNTIAITASGMMVLAPLINPTISYDPRKDFAPVGTVVEYANVLVVNPKLPVKSIAELVAYAKANPTAVTYASSGVGSSNHLAGELLRMKAGAPMLHVPYKGTVPALTDVIAGHASMMFDVISSSAPHIQAGKLRPLATTGRQPSAVMKEVPALNQTIPGFEVTGWFGIVAPPGIAPEALARLRSLIGPAVQSAEFRKFLADNGFEPAEFQPADLASRITDDVAVWAPVVKAAGLGQKAP